MSSYRFYYGAESIIYILKPKQKLCSLFYKNCAHRGVWNRVSMEEYRKLINMVEFENWAFTSKYYSVYELSSSSVDAESVKNIFPFPVAREHSINQSTNPIYSVIARGGRKKGYIKDGLSYGYSVSI